MRTEPTGRTPHEIAEVPPPACSNGHPFRVARSAFVGFMPCTCALPASGHRTYRCATCDVVDYYPDHDQSRKPTLGSLYDD